jgi:hypothetical protein
MTYGYTKLFRQILDSTVWQEAMETKVVWITMLADIDRFGRVLMSIPGLAKRAGVTLTGCEKALGCFLAPDPYSRTKEYEGRRIEEIDGGWRLLNHGKYRALRDEEAERERHARNQAAYRDRQNDEKDNQESDRESDRVTGHVTESDPIASTKASALLKTKRKATKTAGADAPSSRSRKRVSYPDDFAAWFLTYRKGTGRGTTKAEALDEYLKLTDEDREALEQRTSDWLSRRSAAKAVGVFVPEAPDPVRFLRYRRWEDEFDTPSETAPPRSDPVRDSYAALVAAKDEP